MAWRFHGRAHVDPERPSAFGSCDRCGFLYNRRDLSEQHDWAGATLVGQNIRVCDRCLDEPNQQMKTVILPPDPMPVYQPRIEPYNIDETDVRLLEDGNDRSIEDGDDRLRDNTDEVN